METMFSMTTFLAAFSHIKGTATISFTVLFVLKILLYNLGIHFNFTNLYNYVSFYICKF